MATNASIVQPVNITDNVTYQHFQGFANATPDTLSQPPYSMSGTIILGIVLSLITAVCIVGNSLVFMAFVSVQKLRTPSNYLILSLSISDWLVGIVVMPLSIVYELSGVWPLGPRACAAWVTLDVTLCSASILSLMMISIDRYMVITKPFRYVLRRSTRLMALYTFLAWGLSLAISTTPMIVGWNTQHYNGLCVINQEVGYQIYATVGAFYLPLVVMIALYGKIYSISSRMSRTDAKNNPTQYLSPAAALYRSMRSRNSSGLSPSPDATTTVSNMSEKSSDDQSDSAFDGTDNLDPQNNDTSFDGNKSNPQILVVKLQKYERRRSAGSRLAVKTLGAIMGLFIVCWLPFFVLAVVRSICSESCHIPPWVTTVLTWLGYFNSSLNPIIYARFNREFRTPFKELLCCRCRTINQSVRQVEYMYRYGNGA